MKVYISGPCAESDGVTSVGLARAVRTAYPHAHLVGVSYTRQRIDAQWPDCDEMWVLDPPERLDLEAQRRKLRVQLAEGAWWISGLPWEPEWLRRMLPDDGRLLAPPASALERIRFPEAAAVAELGLSVPATLSAAAADWDLNAFGRRHGWRVWLRTADSASREGHSSRIESWQAFQHIRTRLGVGAFAGDLFLQEHIEGTHEAIAFCALHGELLGSALLTRPAASARRELMGYTVAQVPPPLASALERVLCGLQWTGGGEVRLIRDALGGRWVIGWRASFPGWIFGAALAGQNLPAQLLERACGVPALRSAEVSMEFARVVIEVPIQRSAGPASLAAVDTAPHGAHPLDMLANAATAVPQISPELVADVAEVAPVLEETPAWLFLPTMAQSAFAGARRLMRQFSTTEAQVRIAYSVKTNPDRRLVELANSSGLLLETISQAEVRAVNACGIPADRIILNGPAKRWPAIERLREPLHAVFCDSWEELTAFGMDGMREALPCEILGVRLRTPGHASRFGIPFGASDDIAAMGALIARLSGAPRFGVHFHLASNAIGLDSWWRLFDQMLAWAQELELASGRPISCLDLGGGWFPDDWSEELATHFGARILGQVRATLPHVRELILEPGRALAQPSMALAVRVLEVRRGRGGAGDDVVVDGSIAELAYHNYSIFPHRILWRDGDDTAEHRWRPLGRGSGRLLGRLCMERDILAEAVELPESLDVGDLLVFCDAGAYDRSMSYSFGRG